MWMEVVDSYESSSSFLRASIFFVLSHSSMVSSFSCIDRAISLPYRGQQEHSMRE